MEGTNQLSGIEYANVNPQGISRGKYLWNKLGHAIKHDPLTSHQRLNIPIRRGKSKEEFLKYHGYNSEAEFQEWAVRQVYDQIQQAWNDYLQSGGYGPAMVSGGSRRKRRKSRSKQSRSKKSRSKQSRSKKSRSKQSRSKQSRSKQRRSKQSRSKKSRSKQRKYSKKRK